MCKNPALKVGVVGGVLETFQLVHGLAPALQVTVILTAGSVQEC